MRKFILIIIFLSSITTSFSQDLNCKVTILDNAIQLTDKRIFRTLEQVLSEFMNNTKWSNDKIQTNEKVECTIQIILTAYDQQTNHFTGSGQIQCVRPVFGSSYNSVLFNFLDDSWEFDYTEFQRLDFNENSYTSNLTSLMGFYAYYILGLDYDSFGMLGGTPYFNKAFSVVSNAQQGGLMGWKPFEKAMRSRYNLIDNILSEQFKPIRETYYKYHRQGLDAMIKNPEDARKVIYTCLELVQKVYKTNPNTAVLQMFFEAKSDELVNIFKNAGPSEKPKVVALLNEMNITNSTKWEKIKN
ncbi:MAG: DUF4835 family protein [Bacteroidota bacterium]